jgi:O-antigen/teichoic acid export membrane protein
MFNRKVIARNVIFNWAGMVVSMVAGFVTAPFLVSRLGTTSYGLWILIASFTSYFGMLDLGVRGAVGRQIALRRAQDDQTGVDSILSTSLTILSVCGLAALLITIALSFVFTKIFAVPPGLLTESRIALILIGLNLAIWLPLNVFDGTLWATQRFDVLNAIDILSVFIRTSLTFALIGNGSGIVTLAWLNLITLAGAQVAKAVATFIIDPSLKIRFNLVRADTARELFGFGIWTFLINAARTLTSQSGPIVISLRLGVSFVTPFSIASRLVVYSGALIVAGTGVLTPIATIFHAHGSEDRQRRLFVEGGKYCLALSLFFVTFFLLLGKELIVFWMGAKFASSANFLAILAIGEALPMSQWITHGVILGMSRHRPIALANIVEAVIAVLLAVVLSVPLGLMGVCIAFAVPATLCRGLFQSIYGCRLIGMSPLRYARDVIAPTLGMAVAIALAMELIMALKPPGSSVQFIAYSAVYSIAYFTAFALLLIGRHRLTLVGGGLARKLFGGDVNEAVAVHHFPVESVGPASGTEHQSSVK